jgi:hypothetical protein
MKGALLGIGVFVGVGFTCLGALAHNYGRNPRGLTDNTAASSLAASVSIPMAVIGVLLLSLCAWGLFK